jgi:hypothetical protein
VNSAVAVHDRRVGLLGRLVDPVWLTDQQQAIAIAQARAH